MEVCPTGACRACAMCRSEPTGDPIFPTPYANRARGSRQASHVGVCAQLGSRFRPLKRARADVHPAETSLRAFIRLVEHLDCAPWANVVFDVNDRMLRVLTCTHMHLIVGKRAFESSDRPSLVRIVDPSNSSFDSYNNVIWITNRQQGKTSTLAKFIAALAMHSCVGGHLCNVYSTSLDRANELTRAARAYVRWAIAEHPHYKHVSITTDNNTTFIVSNGLADNKVVARPKNPDSCRGDAPEACFFDEIGFCSSQFWFKFALPLLQVSNRVATCTTTPPAEDSFFAIFAERVRARNVEGDNFFFLTNHSLSCGTCIEAGEAERCCHNLAFLPPWKSLLRFNAMKALVPRKQAATFRQEVYGVLSEQASTYFPPKLVDAAFARERRVLEHGSAPVWVGVDPASHTVSDLGIAAVVVKRGMIVLAGVSNVSVAQSDVEQVIALIKVFLRRLRVIVGPLAPLVPVVEVNGSEVFASTIVRAFHEFAPVYMPFTTERFRTCVANGIGVRTTKHTKCMMVHAMFTALSEGRFVLASRLAHVSRSDVMAMARKVAAEDHATELADQLKRIRDDEKGVITGKTGGGDNDDSAIAVMLAITWQPVVCNADPAVAEACAA